MPTSRRRTRVEVDAELHDQLKQMATREGYPVGRFIDKLLYIAIDDYIEARLGGVHPFAKTIFERDERRSERASE